MKLTVEDNNSMSARKETMYFDTLNQVETFIKKNSFDKNGNVILCEYIAEGDSITVKDIPSGDVHTLIEKLGQSFGGDAARFSYTLEE